MKLNIIFIFLFLDFSLLHSQDDSDNLLSYYPLQKGNFWEFDVEVFSPHQSYIHYKKFSIEVLGDSILPNGKKYAVLRKNYTPEVVPTELYFDRIDSLSYNIYRYNNYYSFPDIDEFIIDSLRASVGDHLENNYLCRFTNTTLPRCEYCEFSQDSILGYWTDIKKCVSGGWFEVDYHYWLVSGFGLSKITAVDLNGIDTQYVWHLTYAKIGTKEYGLRSLVKNFENHYVDSFKIFQNYPNPFNLSTEITYQINVTTQVELYMYNKLGQRVMTVFSSIRTPGEYKNKINCKNLSSGLYFLELKTNFISKKIKCLLIK
jgi:hypothetical protein